MGSTAGLMQLPFEIRCLIFAAASELSVRDHVSLLCVSKQVRQECSVFFYQRPLVCPSQEAMIKFTSEHSEELLYQLQTLKIRFEELGAVVMQPFLERLMAGLPTTHQQHPYLQESARIVASLHRVPNIKHLSIWPPSQATENMSSQAVLGYVLDWTAKHYTNLQTLNLQVDTISLKCLPAFQYLRSLQLSGFSLTSPILMSQILSRLRHLQELIVVGPPEGLNWRQKYGGHLEIVQSITPDVMSNMRPLRHLTICELCDLESKVPYFLTRSMVAAIYEAHRDSLQSLHLSTLSTPEAHIQALIAAVVMLTTRIRSISFGWPNLQTDILDCLPVTTQQLNLAVHSTIHAAEVLTYLTTIAYRLPHLRNIKFDLINQINNVIPINGKEVVSFGIPIQSPAIIKNVPWKVTWSVWQPVVRD